LGKSIIQCTCLGHFGRFGNQIFQYLFARAYAEKYNATLEIPNWIGEKIFKNVSHRKPSRILPRTARDIVPWNIVDIDLFGYFQKKQFIDILSESKVQEWLQLKDEWIERFKKKENYSVVAHLRRGDYITKYSKHFCIVSKESYIKACEKFNISKDKIIWLSEETQEFNPELDNDLQFLPDFLSMINADILLRSNSTFSLWAGFFNRNKVYSPLVKDTIGFSDVEFIEGNASALTPRAAEFILR